jgi:hypothetical protein
VKATKDKQIGKWLIIVPPSVTGTGKRQRLFFDTKFAAEAKTRLIKEQGFEPT